VKTHKCVEIGRMQLAAGASGITVSTLHEAEVFATAGFDDILWAFPIIPSRVQEARAIAERITLGVVVDSAEGVAALAAEEFPFDVWVKVDCGYHRCGVDPAGDQAGNLVRRIGDAGMRFAGLLSHSGNAYDHRTDEARATIAEQERSAIVGVAERLRGEGIGPPEISVGSTPSMTAVRDLSGVTEARPGNYVYFDVMQTELGACSPEDCALTLLSTVVSASEDHAVIDAGALALSKDAGHSGGASMGRICEVDGARCVDGPGLVGLSQEHGKLDAHLPVGSLVRLIPNHSCLTAACFNWVHGVRGDHVESRWRVWNGR